ncbi:aminoacyl--tRNA ligase-related protein [Paenibacillus zanthoxyli]|uniref:aminoacyl--tRNA ligase-related protein n=1 Tax=Paenibacillus zanthoxyli TaxID=369399 RepID=UPI00046FB1CA|nr:aminoacyl--tRNA ligase-related protein [Paenibacillus zanthoxyli]
MLSNRGEKKIITDENKVIYSNKKDLTYCTQGEIYNSGFVKKINNDISFDKKGVYLFEAIRKVGKSIADKMGCEVKKYPLLLPVETIEKTNYLIKFSHHCIFCDELAIDQASIKKKFKSTNITVKKIREGYLNSAQYVLSPSACYHMYPEYENTVLENPLKISFEQNVCRNEGVVSEDTSFGRLKSYNIREIVFIGDPEYVRESLNRVEALIKDTLLELGLSFELVKATDSFVMAEAKLLERIQMLQDLKHEFRVYFDKERSMAVASINYHDQSFTKAFNISMKQTQQVVSGCVGIGIERVVLAYLAQFGIDSDKWSRSIRDLCYEVSKASF